MAVQNFGFGPLGAPKSNVVSSWDETINPLREALTRAQGIGVPSKQEYFGDVGKKFANYLAPQLQDAGRLDEYGQRFAGAFAGNGDYAGFEPMLSDFLMKGGYGTGDPASVTGYDPVAAAQERGSQITRAQDALDTAQNTFTENQQRQVNAYRQMRGGGYQNGMVTQDYATPFSGQFAQGGAGVGAPGTSSPGSFGFGNSEKQFRSGAWGAGAWGGR